MNVVFTLILLAGVTILLITSPASVMPALMGGAENSVTFAVKLFVIYAVWVSVLKILEKSGADKSIAKLLTPITKKIIPDESDSTYTFLNLNISANILGMGGAATPMGIKAVESMQHKKNQIMLTVINSSGLQLIPTTIISMRAGHGAVSDVLIPCLIVNVFTTVISIILVKVFVK